MTLLDLVSVCLQRDISALCPSVQFLWGPAWKRALFLGLSNNPHISDLHLDISSCELRSAGAAVIQELFPRVLCVGTLDVSDNGKQLLFAYTPTTCSIYYSQDGFYLHMH
ncbi:hypothetical protein CHARACLAT_030517 [Characodon lateralis]|uniref:Uncharacterized protein n=1 Tax=Characodon lateralis TaxID=208331 RepID=A0ABU7EY39_9TELE|nr:hypothetical protein [Characodon lateralis]